MQTRTLWRPQPGPQHALIKCPAREVLFGGARGGGKTDGSLGKSLIRQKLLGERFNKVIFRQEMPQADDMIERAQEIFRPIGASFNKVQSQFTFPSGGRLRFRPLENVRDAQKYQGQNLSDVDIDEAGNYPQPDPIDKLWGALRGTDVKMTLMLTLVDRVRVGLKSGSRSTLTREECGSYGTACQTGLCIRAASFLRR